MWINQGKSLKRGIENDQNVKYVNIDLEKEQEENLEKLNYFDVFLGSYTGRAK